MTNTQRGLPPRRGEYGIDAPYVPLTLGAAGVALGALLLVRAVRRFSLGAAVVGLAALQMLLGSVSFLYTTRRGKFIAWARLLTELDLQGGERLLDIGCGRGAVLLMAAQLLPHGRAVGVDLWHATDQSGNAPPTTLRNALLEGVTDRVSLATADAQSLPFADGSFDVVVSSQALHNIPSAEGRARAVDEALRVLAPGGRLLLVDFRSTGEYAGRLHERGLIGVVQRTLGWRFWYGGPWTASTLVMFQKPAQSVRIS